MSPAPSVSLAKRTSIGITAEKKTKAAPWAASRRRSVVLPRMYPAPARTRSRSRPGSELPWGRGRAVSMIHPIAKKETASNSSAVWTLEAATTAPARTGPIAALAVKATLSTAFPARSSPSGSSIAALTERVSDFAVSANAPSTVATATTAASEK